VPRLDFEEKVSVHQQLFEPCVASHLFGGMAGGELLGAIALLGHFDPRPILDLIREVPQSWGEVIYEEFGYVRKLVQERDEFFAPLRSD
jgi:hypothetical protein